MKVRFCGAADGVTGSCHLLEIGGEKILLDCGQFQGGKKQEALNFKEFPFNPEEIKAVVLSHGHIDHCGRLPLLAKRGFNGDIYCTKATADLLEIMLRDSGYIHEKEAEWKNKKNQRLGKPLIEPLYTIKDSEKALELLKPVLYNQLVDIDENIRICFNEAGHILGSAITEIWAKERDKTSKIVFSGDLGVRNRPILRDPTIIKKADMIIMETTYGNRLHPKESMRIESLMDIVEKTFKRGGTVVIPAFAVGRTQELIYELNKIYNGNSKYRDILRSAKVYIDSPMATSATKVFQDNAQVYDDEAREYLLSGDNPLEFEGLQFTKTTAESQRLNENKEPKIIISASGMCDAGRIRHHLKHNLWDKKNSIVFVGYQAQGSLGRRIVEGIEEVTLFGEVISVKAEVYNLEGFSGHADRDDLVSWLGGFQQVPKNIFLVHGEMDSKREFAAYVKENLGIDTIVVEGESQYDMDNMETSITVDKTPIEHSEEFLEEVKSRISRVHSDMETMLYKANLGLDKDSDPELIANISNKIIDIEKEVLELSSAMTKK